MGIEKILFCKKIEYQNYFEKLLFGFNKLLRMEKYNIAIENLRGLNLTECPTKLIKQEISQFGQFGWMLMTFHPTKEIIRARLNEKVSFSTREELQYKPQKYNHEHARGSTPDKTMFYGAILPDVINVNEVNNARLTASLEVSSLLRNNIPEGKEKITFSKWVVTNPITVMAMCYHKDFINKSSFSDELNPVYQKMLQESPEWIQKKSMIITEYLASEFAKKNITCPCDYSVSAIFSEFCVTKGLDGVLYPSVKADGMGYNITISPDAVDKSLKLVAAGECTIYKKDDNTFIDNDTVCIIENDRLPFQFSPVEFPYHFGEEESLKRIK